MSGATGLNLADAIEELRRELALSRSRAGAADVRFPVTGVTVELQLVVTRQGEGKAGFKVPVIDLELGASGGYAREATHKLVIELGAPVDARDERIRVDRRGDVPLD